MRQLFRNRDFTLLFLGRLVTNAGDSLYAVSAMWLVYSLTGSTFYTGVAGFLTLGMQALQAFVGPLVDRWPLRRTLVWTQAVQAVLVLTVPVAHVTGHLSVWLVLAVMPLLSLLNQFVYPAGTAALPRIVDEEELTAANSLFATTYQGSELVFNALAGVLVTAVGAVTLFAVDSVTFAVAVALFAGLRVPPADRDAATDQTPAAAAPASYLTDLREGFAFVRGSRLVWILGASVVANGLLGMAWPVLPAYADLRGDASLYGYLLAALAGGALFGTIVAPRFQHVHFGRLSLVAYSLSAVAWLGAVAAESVPATVALFALAFVPLGVTNTVVTTLLQRLVPESMLGRVVAALGSAGTAVVPFGGFLGGALGEVYGPVAVLYAGGVGFAWIVLYVACVPALRRMPAVTAVDPERDRLGVGDARIAE